MFSLRNSAISPWNFSEKLAVSPWILRFCVRLFLHETNNMGIFLHLHCILTSKRNASVTFDTPCINIRCFLFKEFTLSYSGIMPIQIDMWKVRGHSKLLPTYATPVLIKDYSIRHCCVQSAILFTHKMNRRWFDISIHSLQFKSFSSDAFLGMVNVSATNVLNKSQYFVGRSGCIEFL